MDNIKDYDDDGFELKFDDETTPEERKYFVQTYTNVNMVADRRVHCTCCDTHIGTAPSSEKIIRMHPVLRVTQCVKCYRFYNSGEFEKGEDGSELYCRWCGQGGDVYCCSDCPYVFCKKCILRNLTRVALHDVTSNDNWKCFSCAPKILHHLRAQHWALVNFIEKQKQKIGNMLKNRDQDEITDAMNHDVSQCCGNRKKPIDSRKRKMVTAGNSDDPEDSSWLTSKKKKKKRKDGRSSTLDENSSSDVESVDSGRSTKRTKKTATNSSESIPEEPATSAPKKPTTPMPVKKLQAEKPNSSGGKSPQTAKQPVKVPLPPIRIPSPTRTTTPAAEIDCTPDLFAYLVNHSYEQTHGGSEQSENSVSSSTGAASIAQVPSPSPSTSTSQNQRQIKNSSLDASIDNVASGRAAVTESSQSNREQFVRRVAKSQANQMAPVYHNYNGFRIDLNSASQQSTIRLPNGKVIHVKKQSPLNRNESARFSISTQPPNGGAANQPRTVIAQAQAQAQPPPPQQPRLHPNQRFPTSTAPMNPHQRPGPHANVPQRPNLAARSVVPQHLQSARSQVPPPLVINSVSSGVPMPPFQAMPPQRTRGPRPPMMPASANHMPLQHAQMHMQQIMQTQHMPSNAVPPAQIPNVTAGPSVPNALLPRIYTNDPVGRARTQLERQIFNAISICHQIDGKLKTLMNSNAYKNVAKLHDIKELYIHLSYLFTYTNGRFQSVHDKCMDDMRRLGFKNDANSLSEGNVVGKYGSDVDEDDLEIVEPNHQTIDLDSDDERTPEKSNSKTNSPRQTTPRQTTPRQSTSQPQIAPPVFETPEITQSNHNASNDMADPGVMLDITSSTENVECDVDIASLLQINMDVDEEDTGEMLLSRMSEGCDGIATPPDTEQPENISIENDLKLKSKATISLKPVEQVYPDLMEKALQKMKDSQAKPDDHEQQEQPPKINSPDQSHDEADATENAIQNGNASECSDNTKENGDKNGTEAEVNDLTNDGENIEQPDDNDKQDNDEPEKDKQSENEPIEIPDDENEVQHDENEGENADNEVQHVEDAVEFIDNAIESPPSQQVEATTSQPDTDENEAKSIEKHSDVDTLNDESHAEITSTSTVIDAEINEIEEDQVTNGSKNDDDDMMNIVNDSNEVSMEDPIVESIIEINTTTENDTIYDTAIEMDTTQEPIETESIFSDLSDCNQLNEITNEMNNELTNEISNEITNELTNAMNNGLSNDATNSSDNIVAAILANDDFENISSPDTFN